LRQISGIGKRKIEDVGPAVLERIASHCRSRGETPGAAFQDDPSAADMKLSKAQHIAFELFAQGLGVEEVAESMGRALSTTSRYLCDYIELRKPARIDRWVNDMLYDRIAAACREAAADSSPGFLSRVFQKLEGKIPYDTIRPVAAHLRITT